MENSPQTWDDRCGTAALITLQPAGSWPHRRTCNEGTGDRRLNGFFREMSRFFNGFNRDVMGINWGYVYIYIYIVDIIFINWKYLPGYCWI